MPRERKLTVGLSWVLTMRNLTGARLDVAGKRCCGGRCGRAVARPFHLSPSPLIFNLRVSATSAIHLIILLLYHIRSSIVLVRSNKPCTLRLRRAAWALRSKTWYTGVFFFGIHGFVFPSPVFVAERSTTRGVDENLITSRYSAFLSVVRERTEGGLGLDSASDSSVSERPDASRGGVGSRGLDVGTGSGGRSTSSRTESPFRYEFSILKKRMAPLKLSSCYGLRTHMNEQEHKQTCSRRCVVSKLPSTCRTIWDCSVVAPATNRR